MSNKRNIEDLFKNLTLSEKIEILEKVLSIKGVPLTEIIQGDTGEIILLILREKLLSEIGIIYEREGLLYIRKRYNLPNR